MDQNAQQSTPRSKSLYDASVSEVAIKNFFAGFMHGLGGFFVTVLSWGVLYFLIIRVVVPQFSGLLNQAEGLMKSVEKIQGVTNGGTVDLMAPENEGVQSSGSRGITIPPELLEQVQRFQQQQEATQ